MEIQLITQADFLPYRAISDNTDKAKRLEPHIIEAQRLDLMTLLGEALYYALIKNIKSYRAAKALNADYEATVIEQKFLDLLHGVTYILNPGKENEIQKEFPGLVPVLVYLSYARFVNRDNIRSTPSGFVIKTNMESEPISAKQISEEAARATTDANKFFMFAEAFIRDFSEFFNKYRDNCACDASGKTLGTRLHSPRNRNKLSSRPYRR